MQHILVFSINRPTEHEEKGNRQSRPNRNFSEVTLEFQNLIFLQNTCSSE